MGNAGGLSRLRRSNPIDVKVVFSHRKDGQCRRPGQRPEPSSRAGLYRQRRPTWDSNRYRLPDERDVHRLPNTEDIIVFDFLGRKVKTLFSGQQFAGSYHVYWDATDEGGDKVPSGTYIIRMHSGNVQKTQKVMLVK